MSTNGGGLMLVRSINLMRKTVCLAMLLLCFGGCSPVTYPTRFSTFLQCQSLSSRPWLSNTRGYILRGGDTLSLAVTERTDSTYGGERHSVAEGSVKLVISGDSGVIIAAPVDIRGGDLNYADIYIGLSSRVPPTAYVAGFLRNSDTVYLHYRSEDQGDR